ncbi:carbohydrate ABC transporter permease [Dictyobacter kobayashii]|uniref:Sugar ABC transporter permease n=1 Tax=Dictyobacter kobayashii TaxID=2014872 RepID=A0A402ATU2_9CHLR|nr:carbohydrate ABC transporter permease [Dictyobacter kobayashii]GCE22504.1 sugar ABC transporter permease [Dictyobacter kobayashii]
MIVEKSVDPEAMAKIAWQRNIHRRRYYTTGLLYTCACILAIIIGFPMFWMFTGAFKSNAEILSIPTTIFPAHWTLDNFQAIWTNFNFGIYFWNSLWLALVRSTIPAFTSALLGYVFAKIRFPGRSTIFTAVIVTMMLPAAITLIPSYILMFYLGWLNTYWPLIVPSVFNPYGIFLMRQMMKQLPDETLNAGRIDGASEWQIFWRIALPSMWPGVVAVLIITFIGAWDDFTWPLLVLNDNSMFTLPLGLANFTAQPLHATDYGPQLAGALLSTLPVALVFYFGQRRIVESGLFSGLRA